jgi:hypothetical protein
MSMISSISPVLPSVQFFSVVPKARFLQIALAVAGVAALAFSCYAAFCLCSFIYLLRKKKGDEIFQPIQKLLNSENFGKEISSGWQKDFSELGQDLFSREFAGELPRMRRLIINKKEYQNPQEAMDQLQALANKDDSVLSATQFLLSISRWAPPIILIQEGLRGIHMSAGFGDSQRMYEVSSWENAIFVQQTALFNFLREDHCVGRLCFKMTGRVFLDDSPRIAFDRLEILENQ